MKKTLMALSLALCATVAFAQMPKSAKVYRAANEVKASASTKLDAKETQRQDAFKGSIFTKAPLYTQDFTTQSGFLTGRNTNPGYQTANYALWQYISDTTAAACSQAASAMPAMFDRTNGWLVNSQGGLGGLFESQSGGGFMAMSMRDAGSTSSGITTGNFDSWIAFAGFQPVAGCVYDVSFYQWFMKFNRDSCFLEYSDDSVNWNQIYINRIGVEMASNESTRDVKTVALPANVDTYNTLYLRLRWKCDTTVGGVYGYFWLVDDFAVDSASSNRMNIYTRNMYDGGYQLVPKGMGGNSFMWASTFRNTGAYNQSNVIATIKSSNGTTLASSQSAASLVPDAVNDTFLYIDPTGRMHNYYAGSTNTYGTTGYVPSTTTGIDSLMISITSDSLVFNLDTIKFNVNEETNGDHIWGRDNGWLSGYNAWTWGMTADGLYTDDATTGEAGYSLRVMYCTPATVPQGWVIRGLEIVPASRPGYALAGAKLDATLTIDSIDANPTSTSVYFLRVATGASTYTVQTNDLNEFLVDKRNYGTYNTVRINFPLQPALVANQKYWIGYEMAEAGTFAPSVSRGFYYDPIDSIRTPLPNHYDNNFGAGAYANVFCLQPLCSSNTVYGMGTHGLPMIRMIVGPEQSIPNFNITWTVTPANGGEIMDLTNYSPVTAPVSYPQGSTVNFAIDENTDDYFQLIDLKVNGNSIDMTSDPNFSVAQGYYVYSVANLQANTNCEAIFHRDGLNIADNAVVKVQPNPASSVANLTIEGVNGDVNFALIDMNGRVISQKVINANATEQINLEGLARGTYFVRITNNNFSKVEKLIVR